MASPSRKPPTSTAQGAHAARARWAAAAAEIPRDTLDVRKAVKRHIWSRGLTIDEVCTRIRMNAAHVKRALACARAGEGRWYAELHPPLLNKICDALGLGAHERARLHVLGARAQGWEVETVAYALTPLQRDERYLALRRVGCLCCLLNQRRGLLAVPIDGYSQRITIHHLNEGGKPGGRRRGDRYTVPLCTYHHQGYGRFEAAIYGPAWTDSARVFHTVYPDDDELLAMADELIGWDGARDSSEDPF